MKKNLEYTEQRPVSFLDIVAATATGAEKYYWNRLAYQLTLIVTQKCNMRCTYCYDKSRVEKEADRQELSSDDFVKIIQDARSLGVKQINFTGGEALLKVGIEKMLVACSGASLNLCTNGTVLEERLPDLAGIAFEKLHIHSSLDGLDSHVRYAKNGTTANQLLGIMRKTKEKIPDVYISLNTVINRENIYEFRDMHDAIVDSGVDKWTISTPYVVSEVVRNNHPFPEFEELAKEVEKLLKKHFLLGEPIRLSIGGFYKYEMFGIKTIPANRMDDHPCMPNCNGARGLIIDSFGNVLDCLLDNTKEKAVLKNFRKGTIVNLTQDIIGRPFYEMKIKEIYQCRDCRYLKLCGTGCRYNSKVMFGDYFSPDPIRCSYYPLMEKYVMPLLTERRRDKVLRYLNLKGSMPPYIFRGTPEMFEAMESLSRG
ncbi:radical SAM protein [Patescibacteria group bacterium]|nr:radical SAM protein [Patescibacteria group bacterium]